MPKRQPDKGILAGHVSGGESSERVFERTLRTVGSQRKLRSPNALCSCKRVGRAGFTKSIPWRDFETKLSRVMWAKKSRWRDEQFFNKTGSVPKGAVLPKRPARSYSVSSGLKYDTSLRSNSPMLADKEKTARERAQWASGWGGRFGPTCALALWRKLTRFQKQETKELIAEERR